MDVRRMKWLKVMVMLILMMGISVAHAAQYIVGDSAGWDASTFLNQWTQDKTFYVGDVLIFQYASIHNVVEVNKAGYETCSTANALASFNDGNTQVTLKSPGTKYFICGTRGHCAGGMKMSVKVLRSSNSSSPSPSPSATASLSSSPSSSPLPSPSVQNTSPSSSVISHSEAPSNKLITLTFIWGLLWGGLIMV